MIKSAGCVCSKIVASGGQRPAGRPVLWDPKWPNRPTARCSHDARLISFFVRRPTGRPVQCFSLGEPIWHPSVHASYWSKATPEISKVADIFGTNFNSRLVGEETRRRLNHRIRLPEADSQCLGSCSFCKALARSWKSDSLYPAKS